MPRKHRYLSDMMAELESKMQPPVANYVFLNTHFFTEATPDPDVSENFTIARLRHRASTLQMNDKYTEKKLEGARESAYLRQVNFYRQPLLAKF